MYCNREFFALDGQIDNMQMILTILTDSLTRLLDLVSCQRIVPIYTDTSTCSGYECMFTLLQYQRVSPLLSYFLVYDASCEYSTKALFWIFCCAVILGTFGLIMITLRASYKLSRDAKPETTPIARSPKKTKQPEEERGPSGHGSPVSPVQATPYATVHPPEEAPPGEIRTNNADDDVFTVFTGNNDSAPFTQEDYVPPTRGTHYMDDNTIVREKKVNAIDVD